MSTNPYRGRPDHCFWRQAMAGRDATGVDPVTALPFRITRADAVATAGSCFAQHLARHLSGAGFRHLVTERHPGGDAPDEGYGVFPARFGNIYTTLQLRQLFERAYGLLRPRTRAWALPDGGFADPCRPRIQAGGFPSLGALEEDRRRHLAAVRRMFETCDVFIFTLGLTEGWVSAEDGVAVPLHPGVLGIETPPDAWRFANAGFAATLGALEAFLAGLRDVNPTVRVMLTVSPVSLVATHEDRHVLVSTVASKSILRAVAEEMCRRDPGIAYFPSYEIITGPQARGHFFADDLREVTPEGVAHVMSVFARHGLEDGSAPAAGPAPGTEPAPAAAPPPAAPASAAEAADYAALTRVICDEDAIVAPGGAA
ncbi:GSCFA domain-containing protein [Roseomonas soli]|uniref:GSCFA domain-containing protein n=1 Tax=Neoroseomonas soli TaxID=1081025 RepID=A0A9X9X1B8_9PROT|nr:GSCFA domain-containing protein [Neoroseomonas soli]